jgi:hypothetical protein
MLLYRTGSRINIYPYPGNDKKNFDKRKASIMLNKMIDNLDKRYFMNRKDKENESTGA